MIKKAFGKALIATSAAGALLVPTSGTVAPSIATMACTYPDSVNTRTHIEVHRPVMRRGQENHAKVTVRSNAGTPRGWVKFKIQGRDPVVKKLSDGSARFRIPRHLRAGRTYGIDAWFRGKCKYKNSHDSAYVTVKHHRRNR